MQILIFLWEPNDEWRALSAAEQRAYLLRLDDVINAARAEGVMTLGWSEIDRSLPQAPAHSYVGVFAMSSAEDIHKLYRLAREAGWYDYFDSINLSIAPSGGTNPLPSREYARLLGLNI